MKEYSFTLKFNLSKSEIDPELYIDRLDESGCDDASIGIGIKGSIGLNFTRSASSSFESVASAISDVKKSSPTQF
jgi:hypothetical protein